MRGMLGIQMAPLSSTLRLTGTTLITMTGENLNPIWHGLYSGKWQDKAKFDINDNWDDSL